MKRLAVVGDRPRVLFVVAVFGVLGLLRGHVALAAPHISAASLTAAIMLPGIGHALAGDIERGAVIDRGADDRQPDRDVDRGAKRQQLHRDQTLIVIARDHAVEFAARGAHEHGVAGDRAADLDAARRARAAPPAPARDRLRRRSRRLRRRAGLSPASASCGRATPKRAIASLVSAIVRSTSSGVISADTSLQRHVHRHQHDLQLRRMKHHRHVLDAAQVRQQVGVAFPRRARPARRRAC